MPIKIKQAITLLFLFLISSSSYGQEDSLLTLFRESEDSEVKHTLAGKLYWAYLYKDADFSDSMTTLAIAIADRANSDSLRSLSLHMKATVKLTKSEYDSSLFYIQQNKVITAKNNFMSRNAANYALEGLVYYYKGEYNKSLEYNFLALNIQKKLGLISKQEKTLSNIGIAYEKLGENSKAIEYYTQSLDITPKQNTYGIAASLSNIAAVQINLDELENAESSLIKAKSILKPGDHISLLNDIDLGLANLYKKKGLVDQAMELAINVQKRVENSNDYFRQVRMFQLIGSLFIDKKEYAPAVMNLETALNLSEDKEIGESLIPIYQQLRIAYEGAGRNGKALVALDSLLSKRMTLFDHEKLKVTEEFDQKYQSAVKDKELENANQINTKKTYQRNIALSGFLLLLVGGAFVWQRIKSNQLAQQKLDIIQKKRIADLENERKILTMSSMLEGQEKERYRIAQDLHDGLGGLLSSVKAHFSTIEGEIKQLEKLNIFLKAQEMMDNACEEVRRISHNLMPPILNAQGLPSALRNLVSDYSSTHDLDIAVDIQNMDDRIATNKEIVLYRVCQELLTNIDKHAKATQVEISLYGLDGNVQLIIEDNGIGFDSTKVTPGLGLMSVRSRVEFLKGYIDIDTKVKEGTIISISIPK